MKREGELLWRVWVRAFLRVAQATRDAIVWVHLEDGLDARCGHKDVNKMKKIVQANSYEKEERSKEGIEYSKERFLEVYKDQPEIIRKAKFKTVRFRHPKAGRWMTEQRTKVYDQADGEYRFKEIQGNEIVQKKTLDDGSLELVDDQQQKIFDDMAATQFDNCGGGAGALTRADVKTDPPQATSQPPSSAAAPSQKALKRKASSSDSGDDLSPMERAMSTHTPKKAKVTAKTAAHSPIVPSTSTSSGAAASGGILAVHSDKTVVQILAEVDKSLELIKQQTKLEDITEESLNNLASRLLTKKGAMGKKASKKGAGKEATAMVDDLAKARTKVLAVVDLTKAIAMFEKKRSRKTAQTIADKMHAIKACGVFQFLPACASCFALHSVLFIATLDQRFLESVETVKTSTIMEHCADAGPAEQESIQSALVVRLVTEKVRLSVENKETATVAKDSATRLCNALIPHIGGSIKKLLEAVVCVLQDRRHSTTDVVASLVIIDGNKHNELVKVLTNLEPLDSVISAARKYAAESQRLGEFISELDAIGKSEKTVELDARVKAGDQTQAAEVAINIVETYVQAFKSMPAANPGDLAPFVQIFTHIAALLQPLIDSVVTSGVAFSEALTKLMSVDNVKEHGPETQPLRELMDACHTGVAKAGLQKIFELVKGMTHVTKCEMPPALVRGSDAIEKGLCYEAVGQAALELKGYLRDGKLEPTQLRLERASSLSGKACKTMAALKACETDQVPSVMCMCCKRCVFNLCELVCNSFL